MNLAFLNIGTQEMMLIVIVILFLFGGKKLPELARGLGRGIREFKDASDGIKREISDQINNFEKDLDVTQDTKQEEKSTLAKGAVVAQEINTFQQEDSSNDKAETSTETKPKFPQFGPPAGTLEHNPNSSADTAESEEEYYKYGYSDHFNQQQNDIEYTPGPDDDIYNAPVESTPSEHTDAEPSDAKEDGTAKA